MSQHNQDLNGLYDALSHPILSEEEEQRLVTEWINKCDTDSLNKLIIAHVKMVVAMSVRMRRTHVSFMDLVYEGIAGITEAAHRFDPGKGARFSVYAKLWAKLYMRNYIFSNWSVVKIGGKVEHRNLFFSWSRLRDASSLPSDTITQTEIERMTTELDVKPSDVLYLASRFSGGDVSLDAPISAENPTTWINCVTDTQAPDEDALLKGIDHISIKSALDDALTTLADNERHIVQRHWLDTPPKSLGELSQDLGLSKEHIRNVEKRALRKLRPYLMHYANDIHSFLT